MFMFSVTLFLLALVSMVTRSTFAESDNEDVLSSGEDGARYVVFYDGGEKLIAKTDSVTVGEALEKANIILNSGDKVEPSLDAEINADDYFVNIYRLIQWLKERRVKTVLTLHAASSPACSFFSAAGLASISGIFA